MSHRAGKGLTFFIAFMIGWIMEPYFVALIKWLAP